MIQTATQIRDILTNSELIDVVEKLVDEDSLELMLDELTEKLTNFIHNL